MSATCYHGRTLAFSEEREVDDYSARPLKSFEEDMGVIKAMRQGAGGFLGLNLGPWLGPCSHDVFIFNLTNRRCVSMKTRDETAERKVSLDNLQIINLRF